MRVLIAGATGAVGSRLVPLLVAAGRKVTGPARSPAKAEIAQPGRRPLRPSSTPSTRRRSEPRCSRRAPRPSCRLGPELVGGRKDTVEMHEVAGIGQRRQFVARPFDRRRRGERNAAVHRPKLLRLALGEDRGACEDGGSAARFPRRRLSCGGRGDPSSRGCRRRLDRIRRARAAATAPSTGRARALFDAFVHRSAAPPAGVPVVGDGGGFWSFLHVDDAAAATAIAVVRGTPGLYNIVDDDPAPVSDWLPALAAMVGGKSPRRIPRWLGRIAAGEHLVSMMTESRAGSNESEGPEKRAAAWRPAHASWRQGFAEVPLQQRI